MSLLDHKNKKILNLLSDGFPKRSLFFCTTTLHGGRTDATETTSNQPIRTQYHNTQAADDQSEPKIWYEITDKLTDKITSIIVVEMRNIRKIGSTAENMI